MSLIDTGYRRWTGASTGVWARRWVIVRTGITLCLKSKILRAILMLSWSTTLGMAALFFVFGQLMAPESALLAYIGENLGQRATDVINGIAAWFLLYPDICVDGIYRVVMFGVMHLYLGLTFFAVILFIPKLIAQDLSSNAIIIYNSKALTRRDYLLGKFGVVFGILSMLWVVPVVASWAVGNLMAPYWAFFYHSLPALGIALGIALVGGVSLSLIAMAISALAKRSSVAIAVWTVGWIVTSLFSQAIGQFHAWGYYLSPSRCVEILGTTLFNLPAIASNAKNMLPMFDMLVGSTREMEELPDGLLEAGSIWEPMVFLAGYSLVAIAIISKRVRAE